MQSQPLTTYEAVAVLRRQVGKAQADGLSRRQAESVVARRFGLDPVKVAAVLEREQTA
jgi:hypothetical protein